MKPILRVLKSAANAALHRTVRYKLVPLERPTRTYLEFFEHIKTLGFHPKTVIDVGAADGTHDLHTAFPDAQFVLIEPLAEFEPALRKLASQYNASVHMAAAGSQAGEAELAVSTDLFGSSLDHEVAEASSVRSVSVATLDDLIGETNAHGPMLVKVDVQGHEIDVLRGAAQSVANFEVIILETTTFRVCDHDLYSMVTFMKGLGYSVYDILDGLLRPYDNALGQIDLVFVKDDGLFRQSTAWR